MKAYYFAPEDGKLRYNDGRIVSEGVTHEVSCTPKVCLIGLHGSVRPIDALEYAPGNQLYIVDISGKVDIGSDKICGTNRTYLKKVPNCEALLREFARAVALVVVLKYCPDINPVVINWLKTGDESIRDAAWGAARAAARDAAWDAARAAARAAAWDAARYAARDAARYAARDAAWGAARDAARAAARDAARAEQNKILESLINKYITNHNSD